MFFIYSNTIRVLNVCSTYMQDINSSFNCRFGFKTDERNGARENVTVKYRI